MKFYSTQLRVGTYENKPNRCYLSTSKWDDFGFRTSFEVCLFDKSGARHDLGHVRILKRGMQQGYVPMPENGFISLGLDYCSLGSDYLYYAALSKLPFIVRDDYLKSMRDCVYTPAIYDEFKEEKGFQDSLLRSATHNDVMFAFPKVLTGDRESHGFDCSFEFKTAEGQMEQCKIFMTPGSLPPTNLHALIGRNGVGKTRVLAGIADALTGNMAASYGFPGLFRFSGADDYSSPSEFRSLVIVAFSVFDRFNPLSGGLARSGGSLPFHYVGIKKMIDHSSDPGEVGIKTTNDLEDEFRVSLLQIKENKSKYEQWEEALSFLHSDIGLRDYYAVVADNFSESEEDGSYSELFDRFARMSSGHKIVLLTITRIVELIVEQSLILIDEPETHLHPPLLGSFLRGLSKLLQKNNSVALLATHSPVALQEIPESCVSILIKSDDTLRIIAPEIETFAESVGTLTRKVFGLEVEESGYYKMLKDAAADRSSYDDVIDMFSKQIGAEGRALTRVFTRK